MKVEKKNLNDALRVLGKIVCQTSPVELYRSVRFVSDTKTIKAMATDGIETVSVTIDAETENAEDFCLSYKELKELIRISRVETLELTGHFIEFAEIDPPDQDAVAVELPENFCELLAAAAAVVDRNGFRQVLRGINLSTEGVTATDGKQLLHIPCKLSLDKNVTIPFPAALLSLKECCAGTLRIWDNCFVLNMSNFAWYGRLLDGEYPNWRLVIPSAEKFDYSITLLDATNVISWIKMIPAQKTTNGVELNIMPDGAVTLVSCIQPEFKLDTKANITGITEQKVLTLDRDILMRMLLQGYTTLQANSENLIPIIATGGRGTYVAMPVRTITRAQKQEQTQHIEFEQDKTQMEENENAVEQSSVPVVNPLDELGAAVEEFKLKIKAMFDETTILSRKVREIQIVQKQKERDFIQAKRAIERIRMAI